MSRITKIQIQKNNVNRVNVYIDDTYAFSCDKELVVQYKLKKGLEICKEDLQEIIELSKEKRAFQIALNYLSFKPRTRQEVSTYLLGKEYEDHIVSKALDKLSYYKFLDDEQYAVNYISNAMAERKKSIQRVKSDLTQKGVALDIIEDKISMFPAQVDLEVAKEISRKYFQQKSDLPYKQLKNKLSQTLLRKGYTWDVIHQCLSYLDENMEVQSLIEANRAEYESQAIKLAEKYFAKYRKKEDNPYILEQKVKSALFQKGFEMDIIHHAFEAVKNSLSY